LLEQSGTLSLPAAPAAAAQKAAVMQAPVVSAPQVAVVPASHAPVVAALPAALHETLPAVAVMQAPMMVGLAQPVAMSARTIVSPAAAPSVPALIEAAAAAPAIAPLASQVSPASPAKKAMPLLLNQAPVGSAPAPALAGDAGDSPIRTRSMARLLALQGYRERALSIYDELLIVEPDNTDLRAEADRLRS
jgi:Meckel syndrome type 1 protein